jgi:hypothetical protein
MAALIRTAAPPVRVTPTEIERRYFHRDWYRRRRAKLPATSEALDAATESVLQFQSRRLKWAIGKLYEESVSLSAWRVLKLAGLRSSWMPLAESSIATHRDAVAACITRPRIVDCPIKMRTFNEYCQSCQRLAHSDYTRRERDEKNGHPLPLLLPMRPSIVAAPDTRVGTVALDFHSPKCSFYVPIGAMLSPS